MKPLLTKEEIADLLAPLEPEPEAGTKASSTAQQAENNGDDTILDTPLQIRIEVAPARELIKELLQIKKGAIIGLESIAGKPLDLYVDNHLIASCELVQSGTTFSIRVNKVTIPSETLKQQK